jgi:hypothetical protein
MKMEIITARMQIAIWDMRMKCAGIVAVLE